MQDFLVLAFIFFALIIGFGVGRYGQKVHDRFNAGAPWSNKRYVQGLKYLLNDQTDESVGVFLANMDVGEDTLELYLSLGSLLRREGEFTNAINVHQHLLGDVNLGVETHLRVQFELAQDYVSSGLLDRAEILLLELIDSGAIDNIQQRKALAKLLSIYQETREWLKAIDIADRLTEKKFSKEADKWRELKAQFACELAELSQLREDWSEVRRWAKVALSYDAHCVRATLLIVTMDIGQHKFPAAIASLKMIPQQNAIHCSEMLVPMMHCYQHLGKEEQLLEALQEYITLCPDPYAFKDLIHRVRAHEGDRKALETFGRHSGRFKSYEKVFHLADQLSKMTALDEQSLANLIDSLQEMIDYTRRYSCRDCGYNARQMQWLCPSCKHWASLVLQT